MDKSELIERRIMLVKELKYLQSKYFIMRDNINKLKEDIHNKKLELHSLDLELIKC